MTKGRTVLIIKDPEEGAVAGNYCPITCLPVLWKLLAGIISDKLYESLDTENVLPDYYYYYYYPEKDCCW